MYCKWCEAQLRLCVSDYFLVNGVVFVKLLIQNIMCISKGF